LSARPPADGNSDSGACAVSLRALAPADIGAGLRLCREAGWNQLRADWEFFLGLRPLGCFAAVLDGRVVGTATTVDYSGKASWVGMVLVAPEFRRRGIGTLLLTAAIESLSACACIKLDATATGRKVYEKLGFVEVAGPAPARYIHPASSPAAESPGKVRLMRDADVPRAAELDAMAFGVPRRGVIEGLRRRAPEYAYVVSDAAGALSGFVLGRHGHNFEQIGPLVARRPEHAQTLVLAALQRLAGRPVCIDACRSALWTDWLASLGFRQERPFTRMVRGQDVQPGRHELMFAITGPELG
jgi:ribosomal protein S18 acetylase RimI-like enzyme